LITVQSSGWGTSVASVELWQRTGTCWVSVAGPWSGFIGQSGFSDHKSEGDGTTPTGIYGLGPVMYGNAPNPGVQEPYHLLRCGDWWDEDPSSPGYNTFQELACNQPRPFDGGSEALWQETGPYPSFAVIDYNTGPIVRGAGSAIFFHASTGGPTVGCVSVPLADLDLALRWLDPADSPAFVMGPAAEMTRY
jgi:L,D-peptidoglycan transpeptidase YkuD (ErfK/YbiS/YcfS/YnhG family)